MILDQFRLDGKTALVTRVSAGLGAAMAVAFAEIWWFYLFWLPKFLHKNSRSDPHRGRSAVRAIYLAADFGSVEGGWLSSTLLKRGWNVNRARKTAMLFCALCVVPVLFVSHVQGLWSAATVIALATAAH